MPRPTLAAPLQPIVAGAAAPAARTIDVIDKYTGGVAARVGVADRATVDRAIAAAASSFDALRRAPTFKRREAIDHVIAELTRRRDELAAWLVVETGKPIGEARGEAQRAIDTFRFAADECGRATGELMPLDAVPRMAGFQAIWKRVPIGPCSFITPFNFPLNLAAHKIAPAMAVGCPFVLKPDPRTPVTSLLLGEILAGADLPRGWFSVVPCVDDGLALFSEDERLKLLSFTGSPRVGWALKQRAGRKRVTLELGGNAACIIDESGDAEHGADRIVTGGFTHAGQSCISVQRVLAHEAVYERVKDAILNRITRLKRGDPMDESTTLGPMISEAEARRAEEWVAEAVAGGARILAGGRRDGAFIEPTVLERVSPACRAWNEELFAPVIALAPVRGLDHAISIVNQSTYGLQCGIFTRDLAAVWGAFDDLEVGGVVINDVPTMRADSMPYGGVKASGSGREGVRFAMEEFTEIRVLMLNLAGLRG